jgi:hypothetical protein
MTIAKLMVENLKVPLHDYSLDQHVPSCWSVLRSKTIHTSVAVIGTSSRYGDVGSTVNSYLGLAFGRNYVSAG